MTRVWSSLAFMSSTTGRHTSKHAMSLANTPQLQVMHHSCDSLQLSACELPRLLVYVHMVIIMPSIPADGVCSHAVSM